MPIHQSEIELYILMVQPVQNYTSFQK